MSTIKKYFSVKASTSKHDENQVVSPLPSSTCTSDLNSDDNDIIIEDDFSPKSKKSKFDRPVVYLDSWENDTILQPWLSKSANNLAFCKICNSELKAKGGIRDLYNHSKSKKHTERSTALNIHNNSKLNFKNINEFTTHSKKVSMAEIQLSAFCAEHNISFITMDHLLPMLKSRIHDSSILKDMKCARTKTTSIVKNVIGETQLNSLVNLMRETPFSLCVDESTDVSTTKLLSLVVRIPFNNKIQDLFLTLIKVENCDAIGIYKSIVDTFIEKNINYKQFLMGFAADGANVMTGGNHSVATLLKKDCPNLIILKCSCHSFALCANRACEVLPKYVEGTCRDIYNFIQNSPKRVGLFADLQILLDYKPRKMLHPSQTRWLSLESTVNQVLSRIEVLKLFFLHEDLEKFSSTELLIETLHNPLFELYLKFLKFILGDVNKLNRLFQSESPQIHVLLTEVKRLYLKIFEYFIKDECINDVAFKKLDINSPNIIKKLPDIYLGAEIMTILSTTSVLNSHEQENFISVCLKFYIELCNQLLKRFDFDDPFLLAAESISPINVITKKNISISHLCSLFSHLIELDHFQHIDDEWREIRHLHFNSLHVNEKTVIDEFWSTILNIKRGDGVNAFVFIKPLITAILTIPISTANVERIFSQINLNKTKIRNRLEPETLCGILLTKDYMRKANTDCISFQHNGVMLSKMNKTMY